MFLSTPRADGWLAVGLLVSGTVGKEAHGFLFFLDVTNHVLRKRGNSMQLFFPKLRRHLPALHPYRHAYYWTFLGAAVEIGTNLFGPLMMKVVIDKITSVGFVPTGIVPYLVRIALFLLILGLTRAVAIFVQIYLVETAAQKTARDIRNRLYDHVQRLPFAFHNSTRTGDLMSRMTSDVNAVREAFGLGVMLMIFFLTYFGGIMVMLFSLHRQFALAASSVMPILLWAGIRYGHKVEPIFDRVQDEIAKLTAMIQENIAGVRVVRAFHREKSEINRFHRQNEVLYGKNMEVMRLNAFYHPFMDFLASITTALIIFYGGGRVIRGEVTIGLLVAFNSYLMMLIWPVRMVGFSLGLLQKGEAAAERIDQLFSESSLEDKGSIRLSTDSVMGQVDFEGVSFAYHDSEIAALEDINLHVPAGQVVALMGSTGSGKSTLVQLIPRFFDVTQGMIRLDGKDIRDIPLVDLRRQIALVFQENFLFSATIRENIAFGRQNATLEEVMDAARAAQAHQFIQSMPKGYDTVVGERGVGLSGGQRQRVAIARALLCNPSVLILDDSTSSVDQETENEIQKALENLMRGRTTFIIAQRLSSVRNADQIVLLDQGRIVEMGRHEELLKKKGLYRRLHDLQWGQRAQISTVNKELRNLQSNVELSV